MEVEFSEQEELEKDSTKSRKGPPLRPLRGSVPWTIKAFAFFVTAMLLLTSIVVLSQTHRTIDVENDLPFEEYFQSGAGPNTVELNFINVTDYTVVYIHFNHSDHAQDVHPIYLFPSCGPMENIGDIEPGHIIASVPLECDTTVMFDVVDWTWVYVDRISIDGLVPNDLDTVIFTGKLYREEYPEYNVTEYKHHRAHFEIPGGTNPRMNRHEVTVKTPIAAISNFDFFALTTTGISNYSQIQPGNEKSFELGGTTRFVKVYSYDEASRFRIDVSSLYNLGTPYKEIRPDLYSSDSDITHFPATLVNSSQANVNVTVRNVGDDFFASGMASLYLNTVSMDTLLDVTDASGLDKGESMEISFDWSIDKRGEHYIRVLLDSFNLTEEWNESNLASIKVMVEDDMGFDMSNDTDGDGIPDYWEIDHDLDEQNGSDASLDPDSDGLSNLGEYQNLTDPHNSDTDNDTFLDGTNNTLIRLILANLTIKSNYGESSDEYYVTMSEYVISTGESFPYIGYRVPTDGSFWTITKPPGQNGSIEPDADLSNATDVQQVPLKVYNQLTQPPIAEFEVTVNKSDPQLILGYEIPFENDNVSLKVNASQLADAFADPDPLLVDADWDGINDTNEAVYLASRTVDFRVFDPDADGVFCIEDVDSDNDGLSDGFELDVYEHPEHSTPWFYIYLPISSTSKITDPIDPDTDNEGLLDGDEVLVQKTDPLDPDTDSDNLNDWYEVTTLQVERKVDLGLPVWRSTSKNVLNLTNLVAATYSVNLNGTAEVNASTEDLLATSLNISFEYLGSADNLQYTLSRDGGNLTNAFDTVNIWLNFSFTSNNTVKGLCVEANGPKFVDVSKFQLTLNETVLWRLSDPLLPDTDLDGYSDSYEVNWKLSPVTTDTDHDRFWDRAEVDYWSTKWSLGSYGQDVVRAINESDVDGDRLLDGEEALWALDPHG